MDNTEARERLEELVRERTLLYDRLDQISREATQLTQQITNTQINPHDKVPR